MYIKYRLEQTNPQVETLKSEIDLRELMDFLKENEERKSMIEKCINIDPRDGFPSPPRGRKILAFEAFVSQFYPINSPNNPIRDLYPWINALDVDGELQITYDFVIERLSRELIIMYLEQFSDEINVSIENTSTIVCCVKKKHHEQLIDHRAHLIYKSFQFD